MSSSVIVKPLEEKAPVTGVVPTAAESQGGQHDKRPYFVIDPGPLTCKTGIDGLEFDFNYGLRVKVPAGDWRVRFTDRDTFVTLFDARVSDTIVTSVKKYYINFRVEVYREDRLMFEHDLDLKSKRVLIKLPVGTLGDIVAWFPYARRFREKHGCEVYCALAPELAGLFRPTYPDINLVGPDERPEGLYASYYLGIFFPCDDRNHQPVDWRLVGLQKTIPHILGLEPEEICPEIAAESGERLIKEPYVCIAAQATTQAKYWTNPHGWIKTVEYLKQKGYRVLCIDREMVHGAGSRWNSIPYGAENFTGALPLKERVELLHHADFFVGLGSGLSWLAWAVGKPVVMISGFSLPYMEFYTPYRVINYHVCNGCFTDSSVEFVHNDFAWCPRHKDTDRQFECTRAIAAEQVNATIDRLMADYGLNPKGLTKVRGLKVAAR
ncbi:autotransporter strand-loop-strand O-heptosyltransferase [Anaeroselena agilis]|uniref:Autotransporter strand-loop-strand O-heptosyltransferase n=1 Tax=Anaeroselena agilis TaxID=3063788 RepID=A0ABU3P3B7_9FIRM|nr:autotransporter strand-loop-strand O-heptosyltransferase [Selenomonadales bacterium 4137-cl]